jgi:peroxiredoxin family protein
MASAVGAQITACEMSVDVMGIRQDELIAGAAADAAESKVTLFA